MRTNPICKKCGVELTDENWYPSQQKTRDYICKSCDSKRQSKRYKQWRAANPERAREKSERNTRKRGHQPFNKNKKCPSYLGVHVAERVLSHVFKNVQRMPMNNPGYDIICNHNKLIDIKSSCKGKNRNRWSFTIKHNATADYFLCLAFDDREDLNPLYVWLIPGKKINHLTGASISLSTIHKWDEYRLDITKIMLCCDTIR